MTEDRNISPQITFWRGSEGDAYRARNPSGDAQIRAHIGLWRNILRAVKGDMPQHIFEVGANIGMNLQAIAALSDARLLALEPNAASRAELLKLGIVESKDIFDGVASHMPLEDNSADMVFTSGVLIHIPPNDLLPSCKEIVRIAKKYVIAIEYFSVNPETIPYRGREDLLFKRDFGGFYLDHFPNLQLVDYGSIRKRDSELDNTTWWIFRKRQMPL